MQVIVEPAQALTRAEDAMISLIEGDTVVTRAACRASRFAIEARAPLLIEHAEDDPRLNPQIRAKMGDRSHMCVPLFAGEQPSARPA